MNPKDFVIGLKTAVIDENIMIHKDLFSSTSMSDATDEYWKRAIALFNSIPAEQRNVFLEVIRQIMVDTTSNILGIMDGVNTIDGANDDFSLTYGKDGNNLTGDLQGLFLTEVGKT
ncbi:hypothetical protein [Pseudomonas sp. Ant30-3]|uniref:hypothetical protein n=1 Tax=Pseudomonas sp. Ant30-3 TaxID=1488328 RepID=UPI00049150D5|nr:hypothetical protein [Pseudomonas sp. Ant30-3]